jgi:hypothetical protein
VTRAQLILAIRAAPASKLGTLERRANLIAKSQADRKEFAAEIKARRDYLNSPEYLLTLARTI